MPRGIQGNWHVPFGNTILHEETVSHSTVSFLSKGNRYYSSFYPPQYLEQLQVGVGPQ